MKEVETADYLRYTGSYRQILGRFKLMETRNESAVSLLNKAFV